MCAGLTAKEVGALVERRRLSIEGVVQGVGFRPYVYRLARQHSLSGFVLNTPSGVTVEIEGTCAALSAFQDALDQGGPAQADVWRSRSERISVEGSDGICCARE